MITWRLWRGLRYPPADHPLFKRTVEQVNRVIPPWYLMLLLIITAPIVIVPGLTVAGTVYSLLWTSTIAVNINREQQAANYDQLAVLPIGTIGVHWLIATACLHRNRSFLNLHGPGFWLIRSMTLFVIVSSGFSGHFVMDDPAGQIRAGIAFAACMVVLLAENYQSVVSGALIGMVIPALERDRFSVGALAFSAQAGLLFVLYVPLMLMVVLAVPAPADAAAHPVQFALILTGLVGGFILLREWVNHRLWRFTIARLKTNLSEAAIMLDWSSNRLI